MSANDRQVGGRHYQQAEGIPQHWDVAWNWKYNQFEYCITKYVERYEHKNGIQDLEKARHHLMKYREVTTLPNGQTYHPRVSHAMISRCESLGCNDLQAAVLLYVHTGDLYSAKHYLEELIQGLDSTGEATKEYVEQ